MLLPRLGSELVPELVQGELYIDAELEPGTHLLATDRRLLRLQEREWLGLMHGALEEASLAWFGDVVELLATVEAG